ncbi:MAG: ATP-NAD kinase [Chloroflexi bacterium]|nr:ATP-NAD kinase [Chloroflexota bacterium]
MIANPEAGKDVRRLIAHGATIDNQSKVSIVRRVLVGLGALGLERVLLMPDRQRLGARALQGLASRPEPIPRAEVLDLPVSDEPADSSRAAEAMRRAGAGCLVVLGGDGTVRVVARGAGEVPIVPISTGTNNVLPAAVEGTVAGLAAAAVALGLVPREAAAYRHKRLAVWVDGEPVSDALVDVAVLAGRFIGSRAVWNIDALRQVVVTRASPAAIGISAIAGVVRPLAPQDPRGLALRLAPDAPRRVLAAVGPGLVARLGITEVREVAIGERVDVVSERPLVLAMDGEREIALPGEDTAWLTLHLDGPWIVDAARVMAALAAGGHLTIWEAS